MESFSLKHGRFGRDIYDHTALFSGVKAGASVASRHVMWGMHTVTVDLRLFLTPVEKIIQFLRKLACDKILDLKHLIEIFQILMYMYICIFSYCST